MAVPPVMRLSCLSMFTFVLLGRVLSGIIWALTEAVVAIANPMLKQEALKVEYNFFISLSGRFLISFFGVFASSTAKEVF